MGCIRALWLFREGSRGKNAVLAVPLPGVSFSAQKRSLFIIGLIRLSGTRFPSSLSCSNWRVLGLYYHHYWPTSFAPTTSSSFTRLTQSSAALAFTSGSTAIYSTTTPRTRAIAGLGEAQESVYRNLQVGTRARTFGVTWALAKLIHQGLLYRNSDGEVKNALAYYVDISLQNR
jgi:hypothetical protein